MRKDRVGCLVILLSLSILILTLAVPINAGEEYNVLATLQAPTPADSGRFGSDLALSEYIFLIGEIGWNYDALKSTGQAHIYDQGWNLVTTLQAPRVPQTVQIFSRSVDVWGDIIVVGFICNVNDNVEAGKAYIFDSEGVLLSTIQSPEPEPVARFGWELCLYKDILIVAEPSKNVQGASDAGVVHVFNSEGDFLRTLFSPSSLVSGYFGQSIDVNDEFIFIGEFGPQCSRPFENGSVHVYNREYDLVMTLQSPDHQEHTYFGSSVAIIENRFVVGEYWATVDGHERAGRAHIYDTDWNLVATLQSPTPEDNGEFGVDVAIGGGLVVVGESKGDVISMNEGKAYVFDLEGNFIDMLVSPEPEIGAQFGDKVDTDGEIIVVADFEHSVDGVSKAGKVHIFGLGEPVAEPVVEEPVVEEEADETKSRIGIPGFPYESILLGVVSVILVVWSIQRRR